MGDLRRLDHVAVLVRNTEDALTYFRDRLGLPVSETEVLEELDLRLTYLNAGNAFIQLVEPLSASSPLAAELAERGEGLHHICFGVDDPVAVAAQLGDGSPARLGRGRGRISAFAPGLQYGSRIELTESSD